MGKKEHAWWDIFILLALIVIYLDNGIEDFSAFTKEWGFSTLDFVLIVAMLAIYAGLAWMLFYKQATDKDNVARWSKLAITVILLTVFVPYILPKERLFDLIGAVIKYVMLVSTFIVRVIWELRDRRAAGESCE